MAGSIYFRFDKARKFQEDLIKEAYSTFKDGKHLVAHAPTGLGKTSATLGPALTYALKEKKRVLFLTPKIAQHQIAISDLKETAKKHNLKFRAVDIVGRKYMCTDPVLSTADFEGFYEICSRRRTKNSCPFFNRIVGFSKKAKAIADFNKAQLFRSVDLVASHQHIIEESRDFKSGKESAPLCAYEAAVALAKEADVIIADYFHLFSPDIRAKFLKRLDIELKDCIVIIDEAQNLPSRIRSLLSSTLSVGLLDRAISELHYLKEKDSEKVLKHLRQGINKMGNEHLTNSKEVKISQFAILDLLGSKVSDLDDFRESLFVNGVDYMEKANKQNAALMKVASFIRIWQNDEIPNVRILKRRAYGDGFAVVYNALDPSAVSAEVFKEIQASILMSGTLIPPVMYRDLLGLEKERTILREYASPFDKNNRLALVVPTVTTKFTQRNDEQFSNIANEALKVINSVPGNVAVFFPSYGIMRRVLPFLQERVSKPLLVQSENMKPNQLAHMLARFKSASVGFGAVLAGVSGGSLSEGQDMPGQELLGVVVVGIPLAEMTLATKALIDFYKERYGDGWHYGYIYPAMAKAIQAAGRCIRDESDRGVLVFLDERYTWKNYTRALPKDFGLVVSNEPDKDVLNFWNSVKK